MAIVRVQSGKVTVASGGASLTWGQQTAAGSLLVAVLAYVEAIDTPGVPSGWTMLAPVATGNLRVVIAYKPNAAAQDSTGNFGDGLTSGTDKALCVAEYSGCATVNPADQSNSATGSGTAPDSGAVTTLVADEVLVAGIGSSNFGAFTLPTNSFLIAQQQATGDFLCIGALLDRIVTATLTVSAGCTAASGSWAAGVVSFKIAGSGGGPKVVCTSIC